MCVRREEAKSPEKQAQRVRQRDRETESMCVWTKGGEIRKKENVRLGVAAANSEDREKGKERRKAEMVGGLRWGGTDD